MIEIFTKNHLTEAKNFGHYFHRALDGIESSKITFYKTILDIRTPLESILVVNWPEEVLDWSVGTAKAKQSIQQLNSLKDRGLRVIYVWHNTLPHHRSIGKSILYSWFQANSDFIICLNSKSLKRCRQAGVKAVLAYHPFMHRNLPSVQGSGLLVFGRLRNRSEFLKLLLTARIAHSQRRTIFIGSFPTPISQGWFTKIIWHLLPKASNVQINYGMLQGEMEMKFWRESKTIICFRDEHNENSGILINALSEQRRIIIGNCSSASDYEHLKMVTVFHSYVSLIKSIIADRKAPYDSSQFEEEAFLQMKAQSTSVTFQTAIENGLHQIHAT